MRHQHDGSAIILQRAGAGSILAEASLLASRYHCDAMVAEAARVRSFLRQAIAGHFRLDPAFAQAWAAHLVSELQTARLRIEILSLKTVAARVDAWLTWHDGQLPAKGVWKSVAGEIGVSAEALYRELGARRLRTSRKLPAH
jgi:CRP/FNR family transcriptional regulator, dissimilatory nitrate respiration regulator